MDMVKFSTEDDPGFISVVGELLRWVKDIRSQQQLSSNHAESKSASGPSEQRGTKEELGGITICGDVVQSSIVNGCQTIHGDLIFR